VIFAGDGGGPLRSLKSIMKTVIKQTITVLCLCCLCSVSKAENDEIEAENDIDYNGSDCIWIRSIRDYTPLDSRTLLIWGGSDRPYYVRLASPARRMGLGMSVKVHSRDDRLCPYGGDALIFDHFDNSGITVRSISRITKEQAEDILVRYGKGKTGEPQTPAPKELEGAEVEELG
jgi:hypothetical protein